MQLLKMSDGISYAIVDDEDFERLSKFTWTLHGKSIRRTLYDAEYYKQCGVKSIAITLANEILQRFNILVDHADRDFKNNQKYNLRISTEAQNASNRTKSKSYSTSKYKGVYFDSKRSKWVAQIKQNRKAFNLGGFINEDDAALAYNKEAISRFGEFAALNDVAVCKENNKN